MSRYVMFADLGEKVVITDATEHPEPPPVPGAVAKPWNACTIPGCRSRCCELRPRYRRYGEAGLRPKPRPA